MVLHHLIPVNVILMSVCFLQPDIVESGKWCEACRHRFVPIHKNRVHRKICAEARNIFFMSKLGDKPVYLQYCPMAKASWLSNENEIRNPYYGTAMLTCGEVKKTFKW
ncbi:MAG: DUF3347 domain-containing protein [Chitinophagaceae bacterium]|nr:MAG: DUF3347 domain-containing protein [Chitinophagaceae bacterium]